MLPWLPLPAILGFALFGVGGSVFLAYTTSSHGDVKHVETASNDPRVYEARAVPFDPLPESPAQRAESISRVLAAAPTEARRTEVVEPEQRAEISEPALLSDSKRQLRGFNRFASFPAANNYLAVNGAGFGVGAQSAPVFMAPDAETAMSVPVVPEASTWMCGAALFLLVAARGARARWHRNRRRE
ncbi:MAG TPA: hypothetical protein VH252_06190 [Chthoniobacterales bacterium]|nr:hypothetical protein [Chthoniobacterales bacterium]